MLHAAPRPILGTRRAQGSRDRGFEVPGGTAACWHAWIYTRGLGKQRRLSPAPGMFQMQEPQCPALPTRPSGSQFLHTPAGRGELHRRAISSHSHGTECSPGSAPAPGGSERGREGSEGSPEVPRAPPGTAGRARPSSAPGGDRFPRPLHTAAGLRGAPKTGSQRCNFEGNSQSQAIKG